MNDLEGEMQLEQERVDEAKKKPDADLSSVELNLPSGCVDYPAPARGPFKVRPPRVKEVEFLAGMSAANYDDQLTKLLRSLIVSPTTIDPIDLTLGDRQYLHVWVRAQIDPVYRFETKCPHCGHVNKNFQLLIESIPLVEVPKRYSPNMKLTLPKSKRVVTVHLETARDREIWTKLEEEGFTEWVSKSASVITTIDGQPMEVEARCKLLRELPAGDDMFMNQYLKWQRHGPDFTKCPFSCGECRKESVLNMPFRLEFFMPTVLASSTFEDAIRGGDVRKGGDMPGDAGDQGDGV